MTRRVAFVLPSFAGGGAERVTISLVNKLDRRLVSPILIVIDPSGPLKDEVSEGTDIIALDRPRLRHAIPALRKVISDLQPSAVFSTMGYLNLGLLIALGNRRNRARLLIREANAPSATFDAFPLPFIARWLYRIYYPKADVIICPSTAIAESLTSILPTMSEKIRLLRNPIDVEQIRASCARPARWPGTGARFVAAGRLTRQKGFDRLIEWFESLPAASHLSLLGDGPDRHMLDAMIADRGLSDRVKMFGFVPTPWPYYAGADAFLLPSRWEGMPNAALEALACGTPVIATRAAGGISEVAGSAPTGAVSLASPGKEFADAMTSIRPSSTFIPRPPLLPDIFFLSRVVEEFHELLVPASTELAKL